ncbi:hypothetical protein RclHR1_02130001 [Rhizophagus clarus]|uniref:RNase H type-1 domain-containing protein n=1 Tax=Rhizophagus clarus TaxID=94130 RepID=A0A2Z6RLQ5_9GLOM|nr:hypothetical protein RclHR1_02130001 [Rhizophagus clarus]
MAIRIRLQTAQLRLGVPRSILTYDIEFLKSNVETGQHNNSTMIRSRMMGIEIIQSPADQMEWSIKGGVHAICTFLHEHKADGLIHKFNNHKRTSTRGKVATWFKKLTRFIENGAALLADDTVREHRFWPYIKAYLEPVTVKSWIKKRKLLFILPIESDKALILGQINKQGKADINGSFDIKRVTMKATDTISLKKLAICQDWAAICNFEEREVITEGRDFLNISTMALEIIMTGYDVWIEKWLDDPTLQEILMSMKQAIQEGWNELMSNWRINIYTDGSLTKTQCCNTMSHYKSKSHHVSMGVGVYIKDSLDKDYRIVANIRNWPSSTRIEICAILIALMAVPEQAQAVIYTDNQCVIDDITA